MLLLCAVVRYAYIYFVTALRARTRVNSTRFTSSFVPVQQGKYSTQNEKPPKDAGERGEKGIPSPFPAHFSLISIRRRRTARGPKVPSLSPPTGGCPAGPGRERSLGLACPPLAPVGFSQLWRPGQALGRAESRREPRSACKPPRRWRDAGAASRGGERREPARRREPGDGASPPRGRERSRGPAAEAA
ncbi:Mitochondrial Import Receptor Subunit Tom70 [Manis pentadactyla]|nr:Mitochondrial Import Receptor Subunit Tom70 [Manis pentadactyla]